MVVGVERLAGHPLGREHGQVGDLAPDLAERALRLRLDLAARALEHLVALLAGAVLGLGIDPVRRPPRARNDVLGLLARLAEAGAVLR